MAQRRRFAHRSAQHHRVVEVVVLVLGQRGRRLHGRPAVSSGSLVPAETFVPSLSWQMLVCVFSKEGFAAAKKARQVFPSPAQRPLRTANHDAVCPSCAHRRLRRTIHRPSAPYPRQSAMTLTTRCGGGSRAPGRPSYASGHRLRSERFQELNAGQKAPGITKRRSRAPPPTLMPPMIVSSR